MREICLDTETTGMAAKEGDRIIEIGCVELGEHGLTDKNFHEYIDPERQMEAEVIRVHKITNEFLVGKPKFADIADKFIEFVQGARLIIHNARQTLDGRDLRQGQHYRLDGACQSRIPSDAQQLGCIV